MDFASAEHFYNSLVRDCLVNQGREVRYLALILGWAGGDVNESRMFAVNGSRTSRTRRSFRWKLLCAI